MSRAGELKAPVLQHTWQKITGNLPGESTAEDLAVLAARHPETTSSPRTRAATGSWASDLAGSDQCGCRDLRRRPHGRRRRDGRP